MGMFDIVKVPGVRSCQVKCWQDPTMSTYTIGDKVPGIGGFQSYSIALQEYVTDTGVPRKFLNVTSHSIVGVTSVPAHRARFDKWGVPLKNGLIDANGSPYSDTFKAFPFYVHGKAQG